MIGLAYIAKETKEKEAKEKEAKDKEAKDSADKLRSSLMFDKGEVVSVSNKWQLGCESSAAFILGAANLGVAHWMLGWRVKHLIFAVVGDNS